MFKATFCFTLILCYIKCSVSTPTVPPKATDKKSSLSSIIGTLLVQLAENWSLQPRPEGIIIRLELASVAVDEHSAFPAPNFKEDQIDYKSAKAIITLWQRLSTMNKTNDILTKVTESLHEVEKTQLTKLLFERLELEIKKDPKLYAEFVKVRSQVANESSPHVHDVAKKADKDKSEAIVDFLQLPKITKLIYIKRFIILSIKDNLITPKEMEKEVCAQINAIWKVAEIPEFTPKLQKFYDEALDEVIKNNPGPHTRWIEGSQELFQNLKKKLNSSDEKLKSKIETAEKEMVRSDACNSKVYSDISASLWLF